jgi:hypothetical protein
VTDLSGVHRFDAANWHTRRVNRLTYMLLVVVAVYCLTSVAIALATAEKCGKISAQKQWVVVPPHWECRG